MNYIKTYESFGSDNSFQETLEKLSKKIDTKKLYSILKPYKKQLRKLYTKYSTNGIINTSMIENDINKTSSVSEGFGDSLLKRIGNLLKLPFELIGNLFSFIREMWTDGSVGKFMVVFIALITFVLGFMFYQVGEHALNGIEIGIVNSSEFVPAHYETRTHSYSDSKGHKHTYTTREWVPDTWKVEVRANNGRVENWSTTDRTSGVSMHEEDVIRKTDEWDWTLTTNYGDDTNGSFSGGGSGGYF